MLNFKNFVLLIFFVFAAGCSNSSFYASEYTEMAIKESGYKSNKSVVYFLQPRSCGTGIGQLHEIFLNDFSIGVLEKHTYFPIYLKPGTYTFWGKRAIFSIDKKVPFTITVEANKSYYIKADFKWSDEMFGYYVDLIKVNEADGVEYLNNFKLSGLPPYIHMIIKKSNKPNKELSSTIEILSSISNKEDIKFKALDDVYVGKLRRYPDFNYAVIFKAIANEERLLFLKRPITNQMPIIAELNGEQIFSMEENYLFVEIDGKKLAINKDLVSYYYIDPQANLKRTVFLIGNKTTTLELIGKKYKTNKKTISSCKITKDQKLIGYGDESFDLYEITLLTDKKENNILTITSLPIYYYASLNQGYAVVDTYEQFISAISKD